MCPKLIHQEHRSAYPITSSSLNASHFPSWHSNSTVPLSNDFKLLEKTEHVHPVEAAKTVRQEGVIAAKKG